MTLDTIVEVEECNRKSRANKLLAAGYRLLSVANVSWEKQRRVATEQAGATFIAHAITYVIGRTAEQEPFPADASAE